MKVSNLSRDTSLFSLMRQQSPGLLWLSVIAGLFAGAGYSLIIPYLTRISLTANSISTTDNSAITIYFSICLAVFVCKAASLTAMTILVKDLAATLRIQLCEKINRAKVLDIERLGLERVTNILAIDINNIAIAAMSAPVIGVQLIAIAGILSYLAILDWRIFVAIVALVVAGLFVVLVPMRISMRHWTESRRLRDTVQFGIKGTVFGAYELKLNAEKARDFLNESIVTPERLAATQDKIGDVVLHGVNSLIDLFSFLAIGVVAFVLPNLHVVSNSDFVSVVMALLYLVVPIAVLLSQLPNVQRGRVAMAQIAQLAELEEELPGTSTISTWTKFGVHNLRFQYPGHIGHNENGSDGFSLQPISLEFSRGEVVFIVGGNGSGKSTLSKLLSFHYLPDSGHLYFNNITVDASNLQSAREKIAVIYSHYHLFEKLFGFYSDEKVNRLREYLEVLGLQDKVQVEDRRFSSTQLSDGQRHRLALAVALLEDREIYLFDEWAADQDPEFREIFYTKILKQMKAEGKLVIVITHDDRYFNYGDRVVVMEYGSVRKVDVNNDVLAPRAVAG